MADDTQERRLRWDERHGARDPIESREPDTAVVELASSLSPGRALELACGDGRNAVWLATRGWQVTGVDFSAVGIERAGAAAARAGVEVAWRNADLLEWTPAPGSADLVVLTFLHLPRGERQQVLAGAVAAVAPGGRLLIVGHDRVNLGRDVPGPSDPEMLYTVDEVVADAPGLEIVSAGQRANDLGDGRVSVDAIVVALHPAASGSDA